jgi:hypothetical protein
MQASNSPVRSKTDVLEEWLEAESDVLEPELQRSNEPAMRVTGKEAGNYQPRTAKIKPRSGR